MAGRKRKSGRRKPSGRLAPDKRPDDKLKIAAQPHRRGLEADQRLDERAESPLGRALLRGLVDRAGYDAGMRFAVVVGEYRATIEAPRAVAGSGRGAPCEPDLCEPEFCGCRRRRERYCRAYEALAGAGRAALREVIRVAIQGEEIGELPLLRLGLGALARHFGYR
jgi:hypothetical protein